MYSLTKLRAKGLPRCPDCCATTNVLFLPNSLEYIRIHPKLVARLRNDKWLSVRTQKPMANLLSHPGSLSGQGGRCPEQLLKWYPDCVLVALVTSLATPPCTVFLLYLCHLFFLGQEREREIYIYNI